MDFLNWDAAEAAADEQNLNDGINGADSDLVGFSLDRGEDDRFGSLVNSVPPTGGEFVNSHNQGFSGSFTSSESQKPNVRKSLSRALGTSTVKGEPDDSAGQTSRHNSQPAVMSPGSSAFERKRKDNINDKIQELLSIIPKTFFENSNEKSTGTKDGKPNKGQILTKSVEYIQHLQNEIDARNRKEVELSIKLRALEVKKNVPQDKRVNFQHTSAEVGLASIGVGPLAEAQEQARRSSSSASQSVSQSQSPNVAMRTSVSASASPMNQINP